MKTIGMHHTRHLLSPRTPWLHFQRDHPLRYDHWKQPKPPKRDEEDFLDQLARFRVLFADDDDKRDIDCVDVADRTLDDSIPM